MKDVFISAIDKGGFDLGTMLKRIDSYHIEGKLTDTEREELYARARNAAAPESSVDLWAKVQELEARVKALEGGGQAEQEAAEYAPGKWYYAGNRCVFEGKTYTCTAPEGVVCVWSPAEYPAYWQEE